MSVIADGVLPGNILIQQQGWVRNRKVLMLRRSGMTLQAIADMMGLSRERIRQMESKARRFEFSSPAARYLADDAAKNVAGILSRLEREYLAEIASRIAELRPPA